LEQKIEQLVGDDLVHSEKQRAWVRDHYDPDARHQYENLEGKLTLLEAIISKNWIKPDETWKLQSLGIAFGDALAQKMGLLWVAVEDEYGRDPALQVPGTTMILFPMTTISKRIERGDVVNVRELFKDACSKVEMLRQKNKVN